MDEADLLADRIAVMSQGKLRCYGSSLFLKSRFGVGYTLTMIKALSSTSTEQVSLAVRSFVPSAELISSHGGEISFRLPFTAAPHFPSLLRHLDEQRETLGLGGYGMSPTSLEEVFLRLEGGEIGEGEVEGRKEMAGKSVEMAQLIMDSPSDIERPSARVEPSPPIKEGASSQPRTEGREGKAEEEGKDEVEYSAVQPLTGKVAALSRLDNLKESLAAAVAKEDFEAAAEVKREVVRVTAEVEQLEASERLNSARLRACAAQLASLRQELQAAVSAEQFEYAATLKAKISSLEDEAAGGSTPSALKQLRVMLTKRAICTKRDWKALIAQHLVPTVLVALTLLLLTIQDPRVGPALLMSSAMYKQASFNGGGAQPTQFVCNQPNSSAVLRSLDPSLQQFELNSSLTTSREMSSHLLATFNNHSRSVRMGAGVLNDTLRVVVQLGDIDALLAASQGTAPGIPADGPLNPLPTTALAGGGVGAA
ncbi:MAG: hypothetical protein SGPRY_014416, partial [Prymnesium sp.]